MGLGSMTGSNFTKTFPDAALVINPSLEFGNNISLHAGGLVLVRDSLTLDSTRTRGVEFFEIGFCAKQTFANEKMYARGGYFILSNSNGEGHRVLGQLGLSVSEYTNFYLEYSRLYAKQEDLLGNLFTFGFSFQF